MKLRNLFIISLGVISVFVMLCTPLLYRNNDAVDAALNRGDSLVYDYPDSVLGILDSIREDAEKAPRPLRMRYELLRADAQNKAYVDFTTDSVMKEVVEHYDKYGTPNQKMKAHYTLGCVYRDLGESPLALESYQDAVGCADTASVDCDLRTLASVYGQMGDLLSDQCLAANALEAYEMAKVVCLKSRDTLNAVMADFQRSRVLQNYCPNTDDSVYVLSMNVRNWLLSHGYIASAAEHNGPLLSYEIKHGNFEKARSYVNEYEKYSNVVDANGDVPPYASIYYNMKGLVALHYEQYDSARIYFQKLYKANWKEPACEGLMKLYTKLHVPDSMAKYASLYAAANDSSFLNKNTEDLLRINSMYRYGRMQKMSKDNADLYARSQTQRFYLVCVILSLVVAIVIIVVLYKKRQRNSIEHIRQLAYQLESSKERLKSILEEAEERSVSLNRKNDEISQLQEQIHNMEGALNGTSKEMVTQSFYNTDIYAIVKSRSQYGPNWQPVSGEEWQMLISKFRIYYSGFASFLMSNKCLSDDQYKVCMLIALNFRESEIALLLEVDKSRVNRLKMQANEKLFASHDAKSLRTNLSGHY